nr:MAG TPA: hypothetical protein [Caudoviricetes sp.]
MTGKGVFPDTTYQYNTINRITLYKPTEREPLL